MTWSYSGNPAASECDAVRFLCGDTDTTDQLVQDEEIYYALEKGGSPESGAAIICDAIAGKFARQVDSKVGAAREWCSQRAQAYRDKAEDLRKEIAVLPVFGAITKDQKKTLEENEDLVQQNFGIGDHDNPQGPDRIRDDRFRRDC